MYIHLYQYKHHIILLLSCFYEPACFCILLQP